MNLRGRQLLRPRRHRIVAGSQADAANEVALAARSGNDGRHPGIAASQGSRVIVEAEARLSLAGIVTLPAVVAEDREDVARIVDRQRLIRSDEHKAGEGGQAEEYPTSALHRESPGASSQNTGWATGEHGEPSRVSGRFLAFRDAIRGEKPAAHAAGLAGSQFEGRELSDDFAFSARSRSTVRRSIGLTRCRSNPDSSDSRRSSSCP